MADDCFIYETSQNIDVPQELLRTRYSAHASNATLQESDRANARTEPALSAKITRGNEIIMATMTQSLHVCVKIPELSDSNIAYEKC